MRKWNFNKPEGNLCQSIPRRSGGSTEKRPEDKLDLLAPFFEPKKSVEI